MKSGLKVGATARLRFVVEPKHGIDFAVDGMPEILCTPWLVWFLEHAAREAVLPFLEPGESTVGSHVDIDHLAATPLGMEVECLARVVHHDGLAVTFQLEARDAVERIAKGLCRVRVVKVERLARRVEGKVGHTVRVRDESRSRQPDADGAPGSTVGAPESPPVQG